MAVFAGRAGTIKISSTEIGKIRSFSLTTKVDTASTGAMGDEWDSNAVVGLKSWSGSADLLRDVADTGQQLLVLGATLTGNFFPDSDTTGRKYLTGSLIVTEIGEEAELDGINMRSIKFVGSGELAEATVS